MKNKQQPAAALTHAVVLPQRLVPRLCVPRRADLVVVVGASAAADADAIRDGVRRGLRAEEAATAAAGSSRRLAWEAETAQIALSAAHADDRAVSVSVAVAACAEARSQGDDDSYCCRDCADAAAAEEEERPSFSAMPVDRRYMRYPSGRRVAGCTLERALAASVFGKHGCGGASLVCAGDLAADAVFATVIVSHAEQRDRSAVTVARLAVERAAAAGAEAIRVLTVGSTEAALFEFEERAVVAAVGGGGEKEAEAAQIARNVLQGTASGAVLVDILAEAKMLSVSPTREHSAWACRYPVAVARERKIAENWLVAAGDHHTDGGEPSASQQRQQHLLLLSRAFAHRAYSAVRQAVLASALQTADRTLEATALRRQQQNTQTSSFSEDLTVVYAPMAACLRCSFGSLMMQPPDDNDDDDGSS